MEKTRSQQLQQLYTLWQSLWWTNVLIPISTGKDLFQFTDDDQSGEAGDSEPESEEEICPESLEDPFLDYGDDGGAVEISQLLQHGYAAYYVAEFYSCKAACLRQAMFNDCSELRVVWHSF